MEDEINHLLSRAESKFTAPNGGTCTSRTVGLLMRRHIVAGEFHFIGKEASTRWAGGPDLSMMTEAEALDPRMKLSAKTFAWLAAKTSSLSCRWKAVHLKNSSTLQHNFYAGRPIAGLSSTSRTRAACQIYGASRFRAAQPPKSLASTGI